MVCLRNISIKAQHKRDDDDDDDDDNNNNNNKRNQLKLHKEHCFEDVSKSVETSHNLT